MATRRGDVDDRIVLDNALTLEQWRLVAVNNVLCPHTVIQRSPIRRGFYYNGVGWVKFVLGESQSRLYPHMRAKCWRCPTAVSKKVSFKFISRFHHQNTRTFAFVRRDIN